jgi:hypothetical protein
VSLGRRAHVRETRPRASALADPNPGKEAVVLKVVGCAAAVAVHALCAILFVTLGDLLLGLASVGGMFIWAEYADQALAQRRSTRPPGPPCGGEA